jgi:DNA-binding transcriptional LysR family regulator
VTTLSHELEQMVRGEAGHLRIGVGPATRLRPLPWVIQRATEAFPRLQVATRYAGPNVMMLALRAGKFDLVFCHREIAAAQDELIRVKIFEDRYVVVVRPDHPALEKGPLSPCEFCGSLWPAPE